MRSLILFLSLFAPLAIAGGGGDGTTEVNALKTGAEGLVGDVITAGGGVAVIVIGAMAVMMAVSLIRRMMR
jgi:hypothetical protein